MDSDNPSSWAARDPEEDERWFQIRKQIAELVEIGKRREAIERQLKEIDGESLRAGLTIEALRDGHNLPLSDGQLMSIKAHKEMAKELDRLNSRTRFDDMWDRFSGWCKKYAPLLWMALGALMVLAAQNSSGRIG